jgi:hypothetical protein
MSTAADSQYPSAAAGAADPGQGSVSGADSDGGTDSWADPSPAPSGAAAAPRATTPSTGLVFDDPLDRPSSDDNDRGWGEPLSGSADDDFTRFLSEKPPHHF